MERGLGTNEVEWTWKAYIRKEELPGSGRSIHGYLPSVWNLLPVSARNVPVLFKLKTQPKTFLFKEGEAFFTNLSRQFL